MLVIVNPIAGNQDKKELVDAIKGSFKKVSVLYTKGDEKDEGRIRKKIANHSLVVAVGGDGTINLVAKIIVGTKKKLGIVPVGSANGFAKEIGITPNNWLRVLKKGKEKKIDTLRVNNRLCLHVADIGFNAALMKRFEKRNIRGLLGYGLEAIKQLFIGKMFSVIINKNKFSWVSQIIFANGRKYGSGTIINPNGILDDGHFEIITASFFGKRHVVSVKEAKILNKAKKPVQIDGEYLGTPKLVKVSIDKKALKIISK